MNEALGGGCHCGAVRYRLEAAPVRVNHCHCTDCRRTSGAAFVTWATVPAAAFVVIGGTLRWRRTSARARRAFCAECGTPLIWQGDADPGLLDIAAAGLDDPARVRPMEHLYVRSRLPWIVLDDGLPRYPAGRPKG